MVLAADNSTIRGLVINRFGSAGIVINGDNNTIAGNFIGTDVTGTLDYGNANTGLSISAGADGNTIGGTTATDRNVISGNTGAGVSISGANNVLRGNYIGTNAAGTADVGNSQYGVRIFADAGNVIGGTTPESRNVISGNDIVGLLLSGSSSTLIQGNYIGTDVTGLDRPRQHVRRRHAGQQCDRQYDRRRRAGARNVISGNNSHGIYLTAGGSTTPCKATSSV